MSKPHIAILGAGPAGLGAAYRLASRGVANVTVLEQNSQVGGNAGSFELAGFPVDYGSHRLHPACDPEVLRDIRALLGDDLLNRSRHGRILLSGCWIHFPLKPLDLAMRLPLGFSLGVATDLVGKILPRRNKQSGPETFATILEGGLGLTICREFYFPYARKLWGLAPEELSATQARRRVSANSLGSMIRKLLSAVPGFKPKESNRFYYPRQGFGQISEAFHQAAISAGARVHLNSQVQSVETSDEAAHTVRYEEEGQIRTLRADHVWSTIPITVLARALTPPVPREVLRAADQISFRAMILVYLVLEQERFTEYDAHYFPGADIAISRLSEPKNYGESEGPADRTVLCAELPCSPRDPEWNASNEELGQVVRDALASAGIPIQVPVVQVVTQRLRQAYPIYRQGYEVQMNRLERHLETVDGLLTFGRQGLFAHDNTHHALYMGYCATSCLDGSGRFSHDRWRAFRQVFETHVVED